tara:strand:- start:1890 stop:2441 length:552 start_codon:yes stop_codon:yes gene_type:complete
MDYKLNYKLNYINSLISYFKSNKLPDDRLFFTRHELSSFDQQDTENIQTLNSIGDIISLFKKSPPEIFEFFNINETMAYKRKIEYFKEAISIFEKNEDCPICIAPLIDQTILITSCNHIFHKDCISKYCNEDEKFICPLCRKDNNCPLKKEKKNNGGRRNSRTKRKKYLKKKSLKKRKRTKRR